MKRLYCKIVILLTFLSSISYGSGLGNSVKGDTAVGSYIFDKFRIEPRSFRVVKCPKAINDACIQWKIGSRQNSQDSSRVLNVTTINRSNTHDVFKELRITMSAEICTKFGKNDESLAHCNYTIQLEECRNYLMRLGPDANSGGITTVPIKSSSLKVELLRIVSNRANLSVQFDIECESDHVAYVDYDIFDKSTDQRKSGVFNALCEDRTCMTMLKDVKNIYFCRHYSIRIDMNNIKNFFTPPEISNLHLVKFEAKKAYLKWFINPPGCEQNPLPLIERVYNTTSNSDRNVKIWSRGKSPTCTKDYCNFEFEIESCVSYFIYPEGLRSKSINVLRPSIINVSAEISESKEDEIIITWATGCQHNRRVFMVMLKSELQSDVIKMDINATCSQNMRCSAAIQTRLLLPCSRYQIQIDGSSDIATIKTPLAGLSAIRANATAIYVGKNSVSLAAVFSEIQGNCAEHLIDATFKILSNPPIEDSLICNQVNHEPSLVKCTRTITKHQIIPPCGSTVPLEVNPRFVACIHCGYNEFKRTPPLNISMFTTVADDLKADVIVENLTVQSISENLLIQWDDSSTCPVSSINLKFLPHNQADIIEPNEISVPATCFKHSNNLITKRVLLITGYRRVECPDVVKKEYEVKLLPCTTYNVSLTIDGVATKKPQEVQFTTFLNHEALKKLHLQNFSAKFYRNTGEIALDVSLHGFEENCVQEPIELEVMLKSKEPSYNYFMNLSCASVADERSSISCAGNISPHGLDICEKHLLHLQTLHRISPASSSNLHSTHKMPPLANRHDDYNPLIRVLNTNGSTAAEMEWSDPSCVSIKIDFWDVVITNDTHEQRLRIQRSKFHVISQNSTESHQYKIVTNDLDLRVTIQNILEPNSYETVAEGFELVPCSNYTVNFVPVAEGNDLLEMSGLMRVAHFTTGLNNAVVTELENITSNNVDILISYPKRCLDNGVVQRVPLAKIDDHSVLPSSQYFDETCKNDVCFARWQAGVLAPCTKYKVLVAGGAVQTFATTLDSPRNLKMAVQGDNWVFKWDPPFCTERIVNWRFQMRAEEEVVADEAILPSSGRSFVFQPDAIYLQKNASCLNFSYRVAAIWSGNVTTWSSVLSFSECLRIKSTIAQVDGDITTANAKSRDWPDDDQPGTSSKWAGKDIITWVVLIALVTAGFLLLATLVMSIFYLRRRKRTTKRRKISETGLWVTTEFLT